MVIAKNGNRMVSQGKFSAMRMNIIRRKTLKKDLNMVEDKYEKETT